MGEEMGENNGGVVKVWDEKKWFNWWYFWWGCNGSGASLLD